MERKGHPASLFKFFVLVLVIVVVVLVNLNLSAVDPVHAAVLCEQRLVEHVPTSRSNSYNNNNNTTASPPVSTTTTTSPTDPSNVLFPHSLLQRPSTNTNVVYFVFSRHNAFDLRQTIRDTWASPNNNNHNVYFVIGRPCWIPPKFRGMDLGENEKCILSDEKPLTKQFIKRALEYQQDHIEANIVPKLTKEFQTHKDLLILENHLYDDYSSLPEKLKAAYTFTNQYLEKVDFVVKVDDDFFVQVDKFSNHMNQHYGHLTQSPALIGGLIRRQHQAFTYGKWKEFPQFRFNGTYPPFALGSFGHVVTRPIFQYVAQHKQLLFNYQGEDNSLGIWIKHAPSFRLKKEFKTSNNTVHYIQADDVMAGDGNCTDQDKYLVGHDVTKAQMVECYDALQRKGSR